MSTPPTDGFPGPGERIGQYEIVRRLGLGGMGVVFEAVDTVLRRRVALKVIAPYVADDPAFRARFTQEAQAQASLDSSHVVPVFAHGEADGALYIASQLIPGGDLGAMLRASGAPPPRTALDLVAQVATGLGDAHATGLVHRDVKPANVLVRTRGEEVSAYLTDFGIARRTGVDPALASDGCADGTPGYLAPELHTGGTPGPSTDVYSLGCLLWAALVGRAPYAGAPDRLAGAHRSAPVPQLAVGGPFEQQVNAILCRAMAKSPRDRYPSAHALRDDLRRVLRDCPAPPRVQAADPEEGRPAGRTRPRGLAGVLASTFVVLLAGGGIGLALTLRGDSTDEQRAVTNIAAALVEDADFEEPEAECTARRLVERSGVQALREQGLLDGDLELTADSGGSIDPRVLADVISVGASCVFEKVGGGQPSATRTRPATVATYNVPSGPR
ncbi:serine/threonine-protein kinase [Nocardioides antri]|uniref:non-specific serine/threonine protein kinase n=1 Tax=Nocardioides antri TaxID=2607659 RepID=A0A5B1M6A1_9ACTN|nr:serine/threonine-protein kinase [Nocardioides antri]KAA1427649.1 serine/threonine protein kinase [Nocardioides antri]